MLTANSEKDLANDQWLGLVKNIKSHINKEMFNLKKETRKYKNEFSKFKLKMEVS